MKFKILYIQSIYRKREKTTDSIVLGISLAVDMLSFWILQSSGKLRSILSKLRD